MVWSWNIAGLPGVVTFLVAAFMAAVVFLARPSTPLNRRFALFLWLAGLANLSYGFSLFQTAPGDAAAWMAGNYVTTLLAFPALWIFAATVPGTGLQFMDRPCIRWSLFATASTLGGLMIGGWLGGPGPSLEIPAWYVAVGTTVTLSALVVGILFLRAWWTAPPGAVQRSRARSLAVAMGSYLVVLVAANAAQFAVPAWRDDPLFGWSYALAYLLLAVIATYGILKHQLFDIELKLKWTISKSTMVGVFVGVFFVSAQIAQAFLTTEYGWAIGGLVAGLLLLAINPLQRLAARVADTAMPGVQDTAKYRTMRKREVYRAALEEALADGELSAKDRSVLAALQDQLGITAKEALHLERTLANTKGVV